MRGSFPWEGRQYRPGKMDTWAKYAMATPANSLQRLACQGCMTPDMPSCSVLIALPWPCKITNRRGEAVRPSFWLFEHCGTQWM
jgi:hypothetical protein